MRKILFAVMMFFLLYSTAFAAERKTLVNGDNVEVGTSANPLKISLVGGGGGSSEWNNDGQQLTTADANRGVQIDNDLTITSVTDVNDTIRFNHDGTSSYIYMDGPGIFQPTNRFIFNSTIGDGDFKENGTDMHGWYSSMSQAQNLRWVSDSGGNQWVLTNFANRNKDHDHATSTNPTAYFQSDTDPDTDNTQYVSITHDQTDGVITSGKGNLKLDAPVSISNDLTVDGLIYASGGLAGGSLTTSVSIGVGSNLISDATGIVGGKIKDDTITDKAIDWGTGTNQVNLEDIPKANATYSQTDIINTFAEDQNFDTDVTIGGATRAKPVINLLTDSSVVLGNRDALGGIYINDDADAIDYTLPTAQEGLTVLFYDEAGGVITVDCQNTSDIIVLDGTALTAGNAIDSPGNAGDYILLVAVDNEKWHSMGRSGTWVDGGAD